jgi:uncharacterized membrane protein YdjX (TVP38/TMEM64 family)
MDFLKRRWRVIAGVLALGVLWLTAQRLPLIDWLEQVAEPLRNMGWAGVAVFALAYFMAGLLCIPCMPFTLAAGYIFGTVRGVIAVHTGCVFSAAAGFLIGRFIGRKHAMEQLRKSERFHFLDDAIAQEGWKIVGLLRMNAIPFGISNYLYGMTKIDFWHYLLATGIAMLPGHLVYVHLASVGAKHLSGRGKIGPLELLAPALGIASMITFTLLMKRLVQKHKAANSKRVTSAQHSKS